MPKNEIEFFFFLQMIKKFLRRIIERKTLPQISFFSETNNIEVK